MLSLLMKLVLDADSLEAEHRVTPLKKRMKSSTRYRPAYPNQHAHLPAFNAASPVYPAALLLPFILLSIAVHAADVDQDKDEVINSLTEVVVQGARDRVPSEALLDRRSPQSVVNEQVIHEIASPVGDWGTVANFTPSFVSSAPNGPGFDAAKNQSLRGFIDGQFNVTMDGIPFADPDNFGHHSTSYFPVTMLDHVIIDRSPGAAPDLGYASFGGSVNLFSESIPDQARASVYASYGSFNTTLVGTTLSTAAPQASSKTGILATLETSHPDGAMSYSPGNKDDLLLKSVSLLGEVRITALYTYDRYHFYNPGSITTTDLASYGAS